MIALLSAALAAVPFPAPAALATAAVVSVQPMERPQLLLAWMPGEVRCDGTAVAAAMMRRPLTTLVWQAPEGMPVVTYRFRIDAAGRPLSITRDADGYVTQPEDIPPSLAASRKGHLQARRTFLRSPALIGGTTP